MSYVSSRNDALWTLLTQIILIVVLSLLVWMRWDLRASGSFGAGGLICWLPNIYLYRRVFAHFGAHAAKQMLKAFYWGEAVKILLTAVGFFGALRIHWVLPPWLFVGYLAALSGFWLAPITLGLLLRAKKKG